MEVKVIGAGPSGSVAAVSAIRSGHSVEVFEEHRSAGYPQHCSGLISKEGLDSLLDIADYRPHIINRISTAAFDFGGEPFEIRRKSETAFVIDRAEFDAALAQKAESEGAAFHYGKRFAHGSAHPGCGALIGADGALSQTAAHYGFPKMDRFAFTLKAKARVQLADPGRVLLFYDAKSFPGFFGWLVPHNEEEAEIGMGVLRPELIRKGFDALLKKTGAKHVSRPAGKMIPIVPRAKAAASTGKTNVLLVGDAAGHVKSSSGGGVVFGTSGARLAGAFVHAPAGYENAWRREIGNDLRAHALLREMFAVQPNLSLRIMARASRALGLDSLLAMHGNMDRPTRALGAYLSKVFNIPEATIAQGDPFAD